MGRFNDELHGGADRERGIYYEHVQGFDCHPDGSIMAVEDWAPDGAHPGGYDFNSPAFNKYYQVVRGALTAAIPLYCER